MTNKPPFDDDDDGGLGALRAKHQGPAGSGPIPPQGSSPLQGFTPLNNPATSPGESDARYLYSKLDEAVASGLMTQFERERYGDLESNPGRRNVAEMRLLDMYGETPLGSRFNRLADPLLAQERSKRITLEAERAEGILYDALSPQGGFINRWHKQVGLKQGYTEPQVEDIAGIPHIVFKKRWIENNEIKEEQFAVRWRPSMNTAPGQVGKLIVNNMEIHPEQPRVASGTKRLSDDDLPTSRAMQEKLWEQIFGTPGSVSRKVKALSTSGDDDDPGVAQYTLLNEGGTGNRVYREHTYAANRHRLEYQEDFEDVFFTRSKNTSTVVATQALGKLTGYDETGPGQYAGSGNRKDQFIKRSRQTGANPENVVDPATGAYLGTAESGISGNAGVPMRNLFVYGNLGGMMQNAWLNDQFDITAGEEFIKKVSLGKRGALTDEEIASINDAMGDQNASSIRINNEEVNYGGKYKKSMLMDYSVVGNEAYLRIRRWDPNVLKPWNAEKNTMQRVSFESIDLRRADDGKRLEDIVIAQPFSGNQSGLISNIVGFTSEELMNTMLQQHLLTAGADSKKHLDFVELSQYMFGTVQDPTSDFETHKNLTANEMFRELYMSDPRLTYQIEADMPVSREWVDQLKKKAPTIAQDLNLRANPNDDDGFIGTFRSWATEAMYGVQLTSLLTGDKARITHAEQAQNYKNGDPVLTAVMDMLGSESREQAIDLLRTANSNRQGFATSKAPENYVTLKNVDPAIRQKIADNMVYLRSSYDPKTMSKADLQDMMFDVLEDELGDSNLKIEAKNGASAMLVKPSTARYMAGTDDLGDPKGFSARYMEAVLAALSSADELDPKIVSRVSNAQERSANVGEMYKNALGEGRDTMVRYQYALHSEALHPNERAFNDADIASMMRANLKRQGLEVSSKTLRTLIRGGDVAGLKDKNGNPLPPDLNLSDLVVGGERSPMHPDDPTGVYRMVSQSELRQRGHDISIPRGSVVVSGIQMQASGGDFDADAIMNYAAMILKGGSLKGAKLSSNEEIIERAKRHPAGEYEGVIDTALGKKMGQTLQELKDYLAPGGRGGVYETFTGADIGRITEHSIMSKRDVGIFYNQGADRIARIANQAAVDQRKQSAGFKLLKELNQASLATGQYMDRKMRSDVMKERAEGKIDARTAKAKQMDALRAIPGVEVGMSGKNNMTEIRGAFSQGIIRALLTMTEITDDEDVLNALTFEGQSDESRARLFSKIVDARAKLKGTDGGGQSEAIEIQEAIRREHFSEKKIDTTSLFDIESIPALELLSGAALKAYTSNKGYSGAVPQQQLERLAAVGALTKSFVDLHQRGAGTSMEDRMAGLAVVGSTSPLVNDDYSPKLERALQDLMVQRSNQREWMDRQRAKYQKDNPPAPIQQAIAENDWLSRNYVMPTAGSLPTSEGRRSTFNPSSIGNTAGQLMNFLLDPSVRRTGGAAATRGQKMHEQLENMGQGSGGAPSGMPLGWKRVIAAESAAADVLGGRTPYQAGASYANKGGDRRTMFGNVGGIDFSGIPDLFVEDDAGGLWIADLKTSGKGGAPTPEQIAQVSLYYEMAKQAGWDKEHRDDQGNLLRPALKGFQIVTARQGEGSVYENVTGVYKFGTEATGDPATDYFSPIGGNTPQNTLAFLEQMKGVQQVLENIRGQGSQPYQAGGNWLKALDDQLRIAAIGQDEDAEVPGLGVTWGQLARGLGKGGAQSLLLKAAEGWRDDPEKRNVANQMAPRINPLSGVQLRGDADQLSPHLVDVAKRNVAGTPGLGGVRINVQDTDEFLTTRDPNSNQLVITVPSQARLKSLDWEKKYPDLMDKAARVHGVKKGDLTPQQLEQYALSHEFEHARREIDNPAPAVSRSAMDAGQGGQEFELDVDSFIGRDTFGNQNTPAMTASSDPTSSTPIGQSSAGDAGASGGGSSGGGGGGSTAAPAEPNRYGGPRKITTGQAQKLAEVSGRIQGSLELLRGYQGWTINQPLKHDPYEVRSAIQDVIDFQRLSDIAEKSGGMAGTAQAIDLAAYQAMGQPHLAAAYNMSNALTGRNELGKALPLDQMNQMAFLNAQVVGAKAPSGQRYGIMEKFREAYFSLDEAGQLAWRQGGAANWFNDQGENMPLAAQNILEGEREQAVRGAARHVQGDLGDRGLKRALDEVGASFNELTKIVKATGGDVNKLTEDQARYMKSVQSTRLALEEESEYLNRAAQEVDPNSTVGQRIAQRQQMITDQTRLGEVGKILDAHETQIAAKTRELKYDPEDWSFSDKLSMFTSTGRGSRAALRRAMEAGVYGVEGSRQQQAWQILGGAAGGFNRAVHSYWQYEQLNRMLIQPFSSAGEMFQKDAVQTDAMSRMSLATTPGSLGSDVMRRRNVMDLSRLNLGESFDRIWSRPVETISNILGEGNIGQLGSILGPAIGVGVGIGVVNPLVGLIAGLGTAGAGVASVMQNATSSVDYMAELQVRNQLAGQQAPILDQIAQGAMTGLDNIQMNLGWARRSTWQDRQLAADQYAGSIIGIRQGDMATARDRSSHLDPSLRIGLNPDLVFQSVGLGADQVVGGSLRPTDVAIPAQMMGMAWQTFRDQYGGGTEGTDASKIAGALQGMSLDDIRAQWFASMDVMGMQRRQGETGEEFEQRRIQWMSQSFAAGSQGIDPTQLATLFDIQSGGQGDVGSESYEQAYNRVLELSGQSFGNNRQALRFLSGNANQLLNFLGQRAGTGLGGVDLMEYALAGFQDNGLLRQSQMMQTWGVEQSMASQFGLDVAGDWGGVLKGAQGDAERFNRLAGRSQFVGMYSDMLRGAGFGGSAATIFQGIGTDISAQGAFDTAQYMRQTGLDVRGSGFSSAPLAGLMAAARAAGLDPEALAQAIAMQQGADRSDAGAMAAIREEAINWQGSRIANWDAENARPEKSDAVGMAAWNERRQEFIDRLQRQQGIETGMGLVSQTIRTSGGDVGGSMKGLVEAIQELAEGVDVETATEKLTQLGASFAQFQGQGYDIYTSGAMGAAAEAYRTGDWQQGMQLSQQGLIAQQFGASGAWAGVDKRQQMALDEIAQFGDRGQFDRAMRMAQGDQMAWAMQIEQGGLNAGNVGKYLMQMGGLGGGTAGMQAGYDQDLSKLPALRNEFKATDIAHGGFAGKWAQLGGISDIYGMNMVELQTELQNIQMGQITREFAVDRQELARRRAQMTGEGSATMGITASGKLGDIGNLIGLDKYKIGDQTLASILAGVEGGQWGLEDRQVDLQRRQQNFQMMQQGQDLARAQTRFDLQGSQFYENFGLRERQFNAQSQWQADDMQRGNQRNMRQFDWQAEDIFNQRNRTQLSFGWQMEDFDRNLRYARGRERLDLMRQRERAVIGFGLDMAQSQRDENRLGERRGWATEDFGREKERFEQQKRWQVEAMQMDRRHFEQNRALARQELEAQQQAFQMRQTWMVEERKMEDQARAMSRRDFLVQQQNQEALLAIREKETYQIQALQAELNNIGTRNQEATASFNALAQTMKLADAALKQFTQTAQSMANATKGAAPGIGTGTKKTTTVTVTSTGKKTVTSKSKIAGFEDGGFVDLPGYDDGGYTGMGPSDMPAGVVHGGEYVVPQKGALVLHENQESVALLEKIHTVLNRILERTKPSVTMHVTGSTPKDAIRGGLSEYERVWGSVNG